jgi:hypothetical protein
VAGRVAAVPSSSSVRCLRFFGSLRLSCPSSLLANRRGSQEQGQKRGQKKNRGTEEQAKGGAARPAD